jgi:hypothetical protein
MIAWKRDHEAAELRFVAWRVDVWLELATGSTVNVELVQLSLSLSVDHVSSGPSLSNDAI